MFSGKVVLPHVVPLITYLPGVLLRMPAIMKVDCSFYSLLPKIVPKVQVTLAGNMQHKTNTSLGNMIKSF